ncbi:serine kinase of the HPr protein [Desulfocucumis palustris]|uniref:Serine kinase of the HPr protein n=1 Tax=Desulfocucumis palustris TaxID=1898651 RepID=A0A2L2XDM5_9FIRM|nr:hypothetical protein [Desulfocucumis palustris]GBF33823.1 serine kinase of the HPr protein [Desulfocucumis palustris]
MPLENQKNYYSHECRHNESGKSLGRYRYKVFGLHVASDILLPELLMAVNTHEPPEAIISIGGVPAGIADAIEKTESYQVSKNHFLFKVSGVGCYYVTNGNRIVVEPAEQAEEISVRLFLLGTAFGSLLMQRGMLPIHGSAVVSNSCCVVFTGVSGAGKSTLLAAFRERGYSFLTDDVAAVSVDADGVARGLSAYPQQKLWRDSADTIGIDTASLTPFYSRLNRDKFAVPVHKGFWQSSAPLVAIYEIGAEMCRNVTLKPLSGMDKLAVLISHTYRPWLIDGLGLKAAHLKLCVAIARQVAVSRLTRPEGVFSLEEQVHVVQQDMTRLFAGRMI